MYLHIDNKQILKPYKNSMEDLTWDELPEDKKLDLYNRITLDRPISLKKKSAIVDEKFKALPEKKQQEIIAYLCNKEESANDLIRLAIKNITNIYNNFRNYTNRRVSEVLKIISKVTIELQIPFNDDLNYDDIEIFFDIFMRLMTEYCTLEGCTTTKYYKNMHREIKNIFLEFPNIPLKDLIIIYIERTNIKIAALKEVKELSSINTSKEVIVRS